MLPFFGKFKLELFKFSTRTVSRIYRFVFSSLKYLEFTEQYSPRSSAATL